MSTVKTIGLNSECIVVAPRKRGYGELRSVHMLKQNTPDREQWTTDCREASFPVAACAVAGIAGVRTI
ncbi:MAG: hypothetical protein ACRCU5_12525 [Rhizobiaceae bacterium]